MCFDFLSFKEFVKVFKKKNVSWVVLTKAKYYLWMSISKYKLIEQQFVFYSESFMHVVFLVCF